MSSAWKQNKNIFLTSGRFFVLITVSTFISFNILYNKPLLDRLIILSRDFILGKEDYVSRRLVDISSGRGYLHTAKGDFKESDPNLFNVDRRTHVEEKDSPLK